MISHELKNIIEQLKEKGKMSFLEGNTKEQILLFEKKNNFKFPSKYIEWLEFSDGGEFYLPAGVQLYGITHKPLIDVNCADRPDEKYVVIGTLSTGDPILCDSESENISIYNQAAGTIEEDEIYKDFFAFLKDLDNLLGMGG